jgi:hypothetical protein
MKQIPVLFQHTYLGSVGYWVFVYIFCLYDADVHNFRIPYKMELTFLRLLRLFSLVILVLWEQPFSIGKCVLSPCPIPPSSTPFGSALTFFLPVSSSFLAFPHIPCLFFVFDQVAGSTAPSRLTWSSQVRCKVP